MPKNTFKDGRWVKIGEACHVLNGSAFPKKYQGKTDAKIPFLKVSDMNLEGNEIEIKNANNYVNELDVNAMKAKLYTGNMIIFPKIGAAIATNKKRKVMGPVVFDNNVMGIKPKKEINLNYLYFYLLGFDLDYWSSSSALPSIRKSTVSEQDIFVPIIEKQKYVVNKLDAIFERIDKAIELVEDCLNKLEMLKRARLNQVFRDYKMQKESKITKLKDLTTVIQSGFACNKKFVDVNGYPHLRTNNISPDGKLDLSSLFYIRESKVDKNKSTLKKGDILFNNTNSQELVGKTCLVSEDTNMAFSNHLTRVRVKDDIAPLYIVFYLNYLFLNRYFFNNCNRWIGQAGFNNTKLKDVEIVLPDKKNQKILSDRLDKEFDSIDKLMNIKTKQMRFFIELKNSVLQKTFDYEKE